MARVHDRHGGPARTPPPRLTVAELLTGWLANARDLRAPDTLDDCADYARHLEASQRITTDAAARARLRARSLPVRLFVAPLVDGPVTPTGHARQALP